jgi:hypothetical protein
MSEPYAGLAQVTIERPALMAYLAAQPQKASHWHDWERIGGQWHGFAWDADLAPVLSRVDAWLAASYRQAVHTVLAWSEAPAIGRCVYDDAAQRFTFGTLTLSQNLNEIVFFFAVARGLATHMRDDQSGFAVVHNYLWKGSDTLAVMGLGADGHSAFLDADRDAPAWEQHRSDAIAVFSDIFRSYAAGGRLDVFDKVSPGVSTGPSALDALERLR